MTVNDIPQIVDKTLGALSDRFGTTGAYLWQAYVRYTMATGIGLAFLGMAFVIIGVYTLNRIKPIYEFISSNCDKRYGNGKEGANIGTTLIVIGCAILLIIGMGLVSCNIPTMFAPDGAALHELFSSMHQG